MHGTPQNNKEKNIMKGKWSGIGVVDGRGKLGGNVATKNAYSDVWRRKVSPINRSTSYQTAVRASFTTFSQNWSAVLTEAQRNAWIGFSKLHEFTIAFGEKRSLQGKEMYIKCNQFLQQAGLATTLVPPGDLTTGELGALTLVANHAAGGTLTLATNEVNVPVAAKINIFATPLVSNGRNAVTNLNRFIGTFASAGTPYNIKAAWIAKYGTFPTAAGMKIAVMAQIVNVDGWTSLPGTTAAFVI
jgi:hypothetical protein